MNKLRPGSIARIDPREDGKLRTSNVTKFLDSCVEGAANRSLSIFLSQTQLPAHLTALVRLLEQSCPHPTCLPPILRHHYRTHVFLLHEVPASTNHSHRLAFPRCSLKVQIRLRPAMWGRRLERTLPQGRRATATKCHRLLRPVRLCVRARLSATRSLRGPQTSLRACRLQIRRRGSPSPPATSQKPARTRACWTPASG